MILLHPFPITFRHSRTLTGLSAQRGSSDLAGAGLSAESTSSKILLADRGANAPMRECGVI